MSYEVRGIDVSSHQGNIDFNKLKNSAIGFVMIRISYGQSTVDSKAIRNINECIRVGMPFGVYVYSYALNLEQAKKEAQLVINTLKPYKDKISYPVAVDMEDADGYKKKHGMPNKETLSKICALECDMFEKEGYYSIVYASLDWLRNKLDEIILQKYDKWIAQWGNRCTYKGSFGIWQYTNSGKVAGINGNVDRDVAYYDYPAWYKLQKEKQEEKKKESEDDIMLQEFINQYGHNKELIFEALDKICKTTKNKDEISAWAEEPVKQAIHDGITDGNRMGDFATREEVVTMLERVEKNGNKQD